MTTTEIPRESPVLIEASLGGRRWKRGTLIYSAGGLFTLFIFLLIGDFAWSVKERAVMPVAQVFLKQQEASNFFVALVVGSLPWALSMLLGPIISVRSDRHRGRWGRRIPFLLLPTPVLVLGLLGMAFTPQAGELLHALLGTTSPGQRWCTLGWFAIMWCLFELASVTANAVFTGLIADVVPDSLTGRFYGMFRVISLLAGIAFTYGIVGKAAQYFAAIFIGVAVIYGLGFLLMCWRVREGSYPPPPPATTEGSAEIKRYMRECFSHRFYVGLFLAMMLGLISFSPVNNFGVFYAQKIGLGLDGYGKALALTFTCSLVLALPVGWLADRWHPLNVGLGSIALYAATMIPAGFLVRDASQFAVAFVAHGVLSGLYVTGVAAIGQYLFPRDRFAQFQSAANLLSALGYTLVPPLMGGWLDLTGQSYEHTFIASGALAAASALIYCWLLRPFRALGGRRAYSPP
ncbi:MFS transporter [Roseateles violae]|uniref:MFS transporter n=1 Tax=Roseateles violae TaxID=3058042 RepID=A0ABT8DR09_9BURK|nr:MFS transporter [Pelomonas sp. PFR6]MDN3919369.1 MFS transporter [Pelomonas sp. PFR6]